jgi:hypothetical protein
MGSSMQSNVKNALISTGLRRIACRVFEPTDFPNPPHHQGVNHILDTHGGEKNSQPDKAAADRRQVSGDL